MQLNIGRETLLLPQNSEILTPPPACEPQSFCELTEQALDHPLDLPPLSQWNLNGKKAAVLIDDWGRPTPCSEFLPSVIKRLMATGVQQQDITIVTASGMHDPMTEADMERKVGRDVYLNFRCISHDAGDPNMLSFIGVTPLGTPVWVNRYAAEADIRLSFGRVFPHIAYGYEGGYKMIVPGIASFETIMRDHSLNFSAFSTYTSIKENPSRREADAIGKMVGIDMMTGYVMDWDNRPITAFAGTVDRTFETSVDYGIRNIWGSACSSQADITILSAPSAGQLLLSQNPTYYLGMALNVTKPDGIIIADMAYKAPNKIVVEGIDMHEIPMDQLYFHHERRNWNMNPRQVQHAIKAIRGAFYYRRIYELCSQTLFLCSDTYPMRLLEKWKAHRFASIAEALDEAMQLKGPEARVNVIPDGAHTLPLTAF